MLLFAQPRITYQRLLRLARMEKRARKKEGQILVPGRLQIDEENKNCSTVELLVSGDGSIIRAYIWVGGYCVSYSLCG